MLSTVTNQDNCWREGKRISSQPDLGLVFPLGNISFYHVNCQFREEVKTDELNHAFASILKKKIDFEILFSQMSTVK